MNSPIVIWSGVAVLLLALVLTVLMIRRRRNIWQRFARAHGLKYHSQHPEGLKVTGRIQDREFRLELVEDRSDTGALGIEVVRMSLGLNGQLPRELHVVNVAGVVRQVEEALEEIDFNTGDKEFDSATLVRGSSVEELRAYFTPARRKEFLELLDPEDLYEIELTEQFLSIQERELVSDRDRLEDHLQLLKESISSFDV